MALWLKEIMTNTKLMVLADQMVFSGNSFLVTLLMVRILSPTDFGVYASVVLLVYLVINVLNAIIIEPLQVTLSEIVDKPSYIAFSFWLQLCLLLFALLGIVFILSLKIPFFELYNHLDYGIVLLAFGFVLHDYFRKLFLASRQLGRALLIDMLTAGLHFGILISALFYAKYPLSDILIYLGLAYMPALVLAIFFIRPKCRKIAAWEFYLAKHIKQAKWLLLSAMAQWWSSNLFVVASGIFLGIQALGAFRLVQSVFGVFNVLLQTFENYVLPQASRLLQNSPDKAKKYIRQIGFKSSVLFGSILVPVFIFSEYIIVLVGGSTYAEYSFVVKGMAILYLIIFLGYPIRITVRVLILNKNFFLGYLLSLLFSLLSFNYLLKEWHLVGAIIGLIVSQLIVLAYWQFILKKNFVLWK